MFSLMFKNMDTKDLFVKAHWRQSIVAALVVIFVVAFDVLVTDFGLLQKKQGTVLGTQAVRQAQNSKNNNTRLVINYQNKLRNLLHNYFEQRSGFDAQNKEWLYLISNTKQQLLDLPAPDGYRELQLKVLQALEEEKNAVTSGEQPSLVQAEKFWQEIFKQFYWLE